MLLHPTTRHAHGLPDISIHHKAGRAGSFPGDCYIVPYSDIFLTTADLENTLTARTLILLMISLLAAGAQGAKGDWIVRLAADVGGFPDAGAGGFLAAEDSLRRAGFRPVSLDLQGDPSRPRISASLVRMPGPDWMLAAPAPETDFRDSLSAWSAKGYQPRLISALDPDRAAGRAGKAGETVFAAMLEKRPTPAAVLTGGRARFQAYLDSAQRNQGICVWVDAHGSPAHPLFTGVFTANAAGTAWNYSIGDAEAGLHLKMEAFSRVWVRPSQIAPIPGGRYLTLWEEGSIGPWAAHARLPEKGLRAALDREAAQGLHPVSLQAIPGSDSLYTALLASRNAPLPRHWSVTGPEAPGLAGFDGYMRGLMQRFGVRAGALAMARDGKLVFSHGYTWAEKGYPVTAPNSLFRVASCSKPLTSILVHGILREGGSGNEGPSLKEKILSLLKPDAGTAQAYPADARFGDVTVDQLLTHSGGWVRSRSHPDPVFNDFPAGSEIRNRLPASRKDFLKYMLGQPLQFDPGSRSVYDNFGFFLLGRLVESLPMGVGKTYESLAGDRLFRPLGLSRPRFGESRFEDRVQGEVLYHAAVPYLQKNPDGRDPAWVPGAYGDFNLRNMDAAGAWILSAPDYAKVLAAFDLGKENPILRPEGVATMWGPSGSEKFLRGWFSARIPLPRGDTVTAKWHNGLFPGTSTLVFYRPDHWSFALFLNRDIKPQLSGGKHGKELSRLADAVGAWPAGDLFPEMGIPAFPAPASETAAR